LASKGVSLDFVAGSWVGRIFCAPEMLVCPCVCFGREEAICIPPIACSKISAFSMDEEDVVEVGWFVVDGLDVLMLVCP